MRKMRIVSFRVPEELSEGIGRVSATLNFAIGEPAELTVTARRGSDNTVSLSQGEAEITYTDIHMFFRLLGLLLEHADEESLTLREERPFQTVGMIAQVTQQVCLGFTVGIPRGKFDTVNDLNVLPLADDDRTGSTRRGIVIGYRDGGQPPPLGNAD